MSGSMRLDPRRWERALKWLEYADQDLLLIARIVDDNDLSPSAAFHCQQAAEKMAKAVLVAFSGVYPKSHELSQLGEMIAAVRPALGRLFADLSGLTDWYFATRYPKPRE